MTYLQAAVTILAHTDRPLTVGEVTATAIAQGLIRPRGRTPDRSMSSVLYRRMVTDPDAPITCADGRFWLRGRPPVMHNGAALRPAVRHVRRGADGQGRLGRPEQHARPRPQTALPAPLPISLPLEALQPTDVSESGARRERAAGRLAARLRGFVAAHTPPAEQQEQWDAERTFRKLVAPLLTLLGYRRVDQQPLAAPRGHVLRHLEAGNGQALLLDVFRTGHALADGDARSALARASTSGTPWVLLTNGRELRLYTPLLAGAVGDPSGARVLLIDVRDVADDTDGKAAQPLWLLSRVAVASGALDAYLASRAVGAALLGALEDPDSALVTALAQAVQSTTGLQLPHAVIARHTRLAIRTARGRDGAPLAGDIPAVAAVTGAPSLSPVDQTEAGIAS